MSGPGCADPQNPPTDVDIFIGVTQDGSRTFSPIQAITAGDILNNNPDDEEDLELMGCTRRSIMKVQSGVIALLAVSVLLAGCATGPKEEAGMVIGGVLGGVLGHQVGSGRGRTAATIIGSIAGVAIGGSIGRTMDDVDRMRMAATLETTRTGVATTWRNPDTGYDYHMVPTRTYEVAEGPCREYTLDAQIGGRTEQVYGTACRQPDGSWRILD